MREYNPKEYEKSTYETWEKEGFFEVDYSKDKNFCIMMPPPNVTGSLHIGHALTFTLQDIMVRYKRMDGYATLWQPGTDHAGIATQNVVEKQLLAEGKTKEELGREEFLKRVWEWKEFSGGTITKQLRSLGASPAWSRERFTMDEGLQRAVRVAFKRLYDEGYIVKGNYMVNWCPKDGALSDIEVEYETHEGELVYIKYPIVDSDEYIVVATTRPETYFGDTAVMVNPEDERYKHLIGKKVRLPIINREIPIIADEYVDMEFGTGAVKVTPAHDPNDYEVGLRHNLELIKVFDEKGILNEHAGKFKGLDRLEARPKIVEKLEELGFIEKREKHIHQVGHCYRCKSVIEPYVSTQWFLKKEVAIPAIEAANRGDVKFHPAQWKNNYDAWMRELRDWCISRQLWWGHQIPVYYCDECGHEWVSVEEPSECPKCHSKNFHQDPDVLDTWFSSALWPFSTLGWENGEWGKGIKWQPEDLERFYPNNLLITGFDILFFWVARMMMMGVHFLKDVPFRDVYLHALVRDEHGQKMSKSKGNVIDPLEIIEKYSADALRFTLAVLAVQGRDIKLSEAKIVESRNFTNKLYNAARFLTMHQEKFEDLDNIEIKTELGKWMLYKFNEAVKNVRRELDEYRFNDAAMTLYRYLWQDFCDWGIELSKVSKDSIAELGAIFKESMKLLHPFMPFLTEFLYQELSKTDVKENTIMLKEYPKVKDVEKPADFDLIIEAIVSLRRIKALTQSNFKKAYVLANLPEMAKEYIKKLAKVEEIEFVNEPIENAIRDISDNLETMVSKEEIDLKPIIERLNKQKQKLQKEVEKLEKKLQNKNFIERAPKEVVEKNQAELNENKEKLQKIEEELRKLNA
ncbi:valine--tRNA ligase [Caminibacter pacificus]|uniref:Valine--tRNA ligase n=1 Tax=Caminibacter pacificus TaxID=1424653 RepID=A0AAJ4RDT7_9BACT|nr:valine--tRNA ligase [Caminibacter pacificus]QCI28503.1 valine--tRNA ligase [Caminibacter pacificus]ROR40771.1 valyl-tRNA synthetase [Caminibacter pacificus]